MKSKSVKSVFALAALAMGAQLAFSAANANLGVTVNSDGIVKHANTSSVKRFKSDYSSLADVVAAEADLNKQIAGEGYTLLKNINDNLPFSRAVKNVTLFGKNSVDPVYSGSGSSGGTAGSTITILQSLENAGFNVNPTVVDFYNDTTASGAKHPSMGFSSYNYNSYFPTAETAQEKYTDEVKNSYANYNDAAVIVLARTGGEGSDLPQTSYVKEADEGKVPSKDDARAFPTFEDKANPNYKYYGGEGRTSDPQQHYLELDDNEKDLIREVTSKFSKVVLLLDSVNVMELDRDLVVNNDKVQSIVWAPGAGLNGFDAFGKILNGEVNPSARTSDTFSADFTLTPANANFANNKVGYYADGTAGNQYRTEDGSLYENNFDDFLGVEEVEYEEGIYTGYKYYETRGFTDGDDWYDNAVNYPFGYGLSYTTFKWEVGEIHMDTATLTEKSKLTVDVKVTNTGAYAGKDVVEMYFSAPYINGGIEKSHVSLGAFAKTSKLRPGDSETVTLEMSGFDIASYDCYDKNNNGHKGYELDAGDYDFYIGKNAHDAWKNGAKRTISGVAEQNIDNNPITGAKISNHFDDSSDEMKDHILSRSDWTGTWPTTPTEDSLCRDDDFLEKFQMPVTAGPDTEAGLTITNNSIATWYDEANPDYPDENGNPGKAPWYSATAPDFRAEDNAYTEENPAPIQLKDMVGVDFDDAKWETYLSQFTITQAYDVLLTQYSVKENKALGMPYLGCVDGTMGLAGAWVGTSYSLTGNAMGQYDYKFPYACETVLACTWNVELANEQGRLVGENALWAHVTGWFAPGGDIHRSEFGGRNFEYYSEDAMLSAQMIRQVVRQATDHGMVTYMKHFALNDEESNRDTDGIATWADEQTMRENYFKVFEWGVEYGGALGLMSSFNRIGFKWTGAHYELFQDLVRGEWGFKGSVVTDAHSSGQGCMNADQMIRCGNDTSLDAKGGTYAVLHNNDLSNTPTQLTALHDCLKRVVYTTAQSNAMTYYANVVEGKTTYDTTKIATSTATVNPGEAVDLCVSDADDPTTDTSKYTILVGSLPTGVTLSGNKITGKVAQTVKAGTYQATIAKVVADAEDGEEYLNTAKKSSGFFGSMYDCQVFTINVAEDGLLADYEEAKSIASTRKTATIDNVDYYTIFYTDGTEDYFQVTNGTDGEQGEKGETGAKGDTGATGATGAAGENGKDGADAKGCGGSLIAATSSVAAVILVGAAVALKKRHEDR